VQIEITALQTRCSVCKRD